MRWCVRIIEMPRRGLTIRLCILNVSSAICFLATNGICAIVIYILIQQQSGLFNRI